MSNLDFSSEFGQRALNDLQNEQVVWLTTVNSKGVPQPSPVWFIWRDGEILIFSEPTAPKVRNIGANANVSLSFNTDEYGNRVTILQGEARLNPDQQTSDDAASFGDYVEKYTGGIESLNLTPETMLTQYSQLITITPTKLRGW